MAQTIKIRRSTSTASPTSLENGELAYSSSSNKLFIGRPGGTTGDIDAIGGKFYTDLLAATPGTLLSGGAVVVDSNSKIDVFNVDNLRLDGNVLSSTNANGNVELSPDGSGNLVLDGTNWPQTAGTTGYFLTTDGSNQASWAAIIQATGLEIENVSEDTTPELGGNLDVAGNSIVSTSAGDIEITPDTTGDIILDGQKWPQADGSADQYLKTDGAGQLAWAAVPSGSFTLSDGSATDTFTTGQTLTFTGGTGITTTVTDNEVTIATTITQYTDADARGAVSAADDLNYNASTGVFSVTTYKSADFDTDFAAKDTADLAEGSNLYYTDARARAAVSVTDAGGDGSLSYNSSTGVITYTGPSSTEVQAHFSASGGLSYFLGNYSITDGGVTNTKLQNSSVTIGTTAISLGATSTTLQGITELTVDNININGNEISTTDANGDLSLNPNGSGAVDVNGAKITNVATPVASTDAATKGYVDAVAEGLHVHAQAHAITDEPLATITGDTVTYNNGTSGQGATLTLSTALDLAGGDIDGDTDITTGDRIIVNGETTAAHNGVYVITSTTVLTRAADFDTPTEMAGGDFIFVTHGTQYADTGWVLAEAVDTVGTDAVDFIQFSGAGSYAAGSGLTLTGTEFSVNVAASGGLEISGGDLQLAALAAGDGITLNSGSLDVVGTSNRISVSADAIDISTSYVGQASITTLGTITTGTWNGDTIVEAHGGTNQTTYTQGDLLYASAANTLAKLSLGTSGQVLASDGTDVQWQDLDGGTF